MTIWEQWMKQAKKSNKGQDQEDITSHSKGKVTEQGILDEFIDIDDFQNITLTIEENQEIQLFYLDSLVDQKLIHTYIIKPLHETGKLEHISHAKAIKMDELPKVIQEISNGNTIIYSKKTKGLLKVDTYGPPERAVTAPENESTVLGPQESFTESLNTSLSLIKKRIKSPNLKTKFYPMGTETRGKVAILYMENIANEENVQRVIRRIENVEYQGFMGLAMLKQMLEDKPYSPFPQFLITVRPDFTVEHLLDGRIIVILDGSPEAAIAPASFLEMFVSPEDLYNRWTTATLLRAIRFFGFFITILFTSTYVSVLTFHMEMLPPALLTILTESRAKVPFPPIFEVLIMEMVIEILREAGARMPTKIGQTLGIVGGIVIGTAAVEAGLASNIMIVIVAVSALLSFLPTNYLMSNAARFMRYIFIIAAGVLGMYGQALVLAGLFAHLSNMTSLGTPYMSVIPRKWTDLQRNILRMPVNFFFSRMGISRAKKEATRPTGEE
jgi:spore germination protein KA